MGCAGVAEMGCAGLAERGLPAVKGVMVVPGAEVGVFAAVELGVTERAGAVATSAGWSAPLLPPPLLWLWSAL